MKKCRNNERKQHVKQEEMQKERIRSTRIKKPTEKNEEKIVKQSHDKYAAI